MLRLTREGELRESGTNGGMLDAVLGRYGGHEGSHRVPQDQHRQSLVLLLVNLNMYRKKNKWTIKAQEEFNWKAVLGSTLHIFKRRAKVY